MRRHNIARGESELKIRFHQDLADTLGGEVTFALDGPILPTPSWKVVAEVRDPGRLQSTIQQLVTDVNDHVKGEHQGAGAGPGNGQRADFLHNPFTGCNKTV